MAKRKIKVTVELKTGSFDRVRVRLDGKDMISVQDPKKSEYEAEKETEKSPAKLSWGLDGDSGATYAITAKPGVEEEDRTIKPDGYDGDDRDV